jgi:hypothetical protein
MRLTAYHDNNGNIVGLAISPADDATPAEVLAISPADDATTPAEVIATARPGLRRTEITVPSEVTFDFDNPSRVYEELDKLVREYRVDKDALARKSVVSE